VDRSIVDSTPIVRLPRWTLFGLAAVVMGLWLLYTPLGALGKADAIGYAVCHRIELRSFQLGDRPLPLCSRCTGMYLGAVAAIAFGLVLGRTQSGLFPPRRVLWTLGAMSVPFAIDGVNSFLHFFPTAPHLYEPTNTLRLVTGLLLGIGLGTVVLAGFAQTAWQRLNREAPLRSLAELGGVVVMVGLVAVMVLSENPLLLYPLALLSGAGVLLVLTGVHTTLALLVFRRENQAQSWRDLALPASVGLTLAMLQIGAIDVVRYLTTGTWSGFVL
jgi:uncharacterized membrane protein